MTNWCESLIDAIRAGVPIQKIETPEGTRYSQVLYREPEPSYVNALSGHTLDGMIDFIQNYQLHHTNSDLDCIHIVSPTRVNLYGGIRGFERKRDCYYQSVFPLNGVKLFDEDGEYSKATLIKKLKFQFHATQKRDQLLEFLSFVLVSETIENVDSGICEEVTVKNGVQLGRQAAPKSIELSPYRTFIEIGELNSDFSLRVRRSSSDLYFTLNNADGGEWQLEAMEKIKTYLQARLYEIGIELAIIA